MHSTLQRSFVRCLLVMCHVGAQNNMKQKHSSTETYVPGMLSVPSYRYVLLDFCYHYRTIRILKSTLNPGAQ
jgi:hypothetical protein